MRLRPFVRGHVGHDFDHPGEELIEHRLGEIHPMSRLQNALAFPMDHGGKIELLVNAANVLL
jgi:hypothetical protein